MAPAETAAANSPGLSQVARGEEGNPAMPGRPGKRTSKRTAGRFFERKSDAGKINALLKVSPAIAFDQLPSAEKIRANNRLMTDKEALCYALELALKSQRSRVPEICNRLLLAYPSPTVVFPVDGIEFGREQITEWAQPGRLQTPAYAQERPVKPEFTALGRAMQRRDPQNVHSNQVVIALAAQLTSIRARVSNAQSVSQTQAETEIAEYLRSNHEYRRASDGFRATCARDEVNPNFGTSIRGCQVLMWNFMRSLPDQETKELLKSALAAKLSEIAIEQPCAIGMIERLIDVPTAVDVSNITQLSLPALRAELQALAARVNEQIETEEGDYIAMVRNEIGEPHINGDPEEFLSVLKRDRFLQMAQFDYCVLRGVSRTVLEEEANRIFPEGLML
jgi:hypothetical protein